MPLFFCGILITMCVLLKSFFCQIWSIKSCAIIFHLQFWHLSRSVFYTPITFIVTFHIKVWHFIYWILEIEWTKRYHWSKNQEISYFPPSSLFWETSRLIGPPPYCQLTQDRRFCLRVQDKETPINWKLIGDKTKPFCSMLHVENDVCVSSSQTIWN